MINFIYVRFVYARHAFLATARIIYIIYIEHIIIVSSAIYQPEYIIFICIIVIKNVMQLIFFYICFVILQLQTMVPGRMLINTGNNIQFWYTRSRQKCSDR